MHIFKGNKLSAAAFSRADLVGVLVTVLILATLAATYAVHARRVQTLVPCAANLKALGLAMALYTKDNNDSLPFAYIEYDETNSISWDTLILPFINAQYQMVSSSSSPVATFLCPQDNITRFGHLGRSYSMSAHDMSATNWPPGPGNSTGVGLNWSSEAVGSHAMLTNITLPTGHIPRIRLAMIHAPDGTLLLTEQANTFNILYTSSKAAINPGDKQYFDGMATKVDPYHYGKYNYLMVDGHVEALSPGEKPGIWTIRPDD